MGYDVHGYTVTSGTAAAQAPVSEPEDTEIVPFDILKDKETLVAELRDSQEIDALTSLIDVNDMNSIISFGAKTAEEISKGPDMVLKNMNMSSQDDSGRMMQELARIMQSFDIHEVRAEKSFFGKMFGGMNKQLDKILAKYRTIGDEVDRIYVQLKQYEHEIRQSNDILEEMFRANLVYFHELEKYIVAGEQGCKEISDYLAQRKADMERTGDKSIVFEIQTLEQALNMLEHRTQDLRLAETVALQSIPMIRMMQFTNLELVRKINSAFIVTLPVFKQALVQAVLLKQQKVQADAISALEAGTREMLRRNARNAEEQAKVTARLKVGNAGNTDELESSWRTIVNGISEVTGMRNSAEEQRRSDRAKLDEVKREYMNRLESK